VDKLINDYYFSWQSAVLHSLWFGLWFAVGLDINLLTNVVSLEAIYLCLFIGMTQKGHSDSIHERLDKVSDSDGK
jgi:hypothetical protein